MLVENGHASDVTHNSNLEACFICTGHGIVMASSGVSRGVSDCPEPPPPAMIFFNHGGDTATGTDPHQPLIFAKFGNPP